ELLGNDFFILPSSNHEMLVLPDDGQVDAEMLIDMVKEVNATQVAPAERLTNDVYHFDTKDHVFEKADRFTSSFSNSSCFISSSNIPNSVV
ncbi:DUF5688 family protein, partial [Blautia schinkii]|uniref:DUF5688 family protein n=1 Tax=Blautia schinkii TaxID=180164 RepID=UPI0023B15EFD